jgi:hypothetical protein
MIPNPHKLGVHKLLKHIPLNAIFDAPSKARLRKAVNIADLRLCAKQRAHKVSWFRLMPNKILEATLLTILLLAYAHPIVYHLFIRHRWFLTI